MNSNPGALHKFHYPPFFSSAIKVQLNNTARTQAAPELYPQSLSLTSAQSRNKEGCNLHKQVFGEKSPSSSRPQSAQFLKASAGPPSRSNCRRTSQQLLNPVLKGTRPEEPGHHSSPSRCDSQSQAGSAELCWF